MGKNKNKDTTGGGKVFLLDIRNDTTAHHSSGGGGNSSSTSFHTKLQVLSETAVHRKIIDLFKRRDDFSQVDLNIRTSRSLSSTTRIDLSNALMHMRGKGKKLRRLSADIDYMDPSVHEFVLLNCLWFDEIRITSNPEEQTYISAGLAMSLRHALTMNAKCVRVLELTCGLSEETAEVLGEAMAGAHQLEVFKLHLLAGRSINVTGILDGLKGKSKLKELHLTDVTADVSESLAAVLKESSCRISELDLSFGWEHTPHFNTAQFCEALADVKNKSVSKLLLDGIRFPSSLDDDDDSVMSTACMDCSTRVLALAFSKMEILSIAAPNMPRLDFLDLPDDQLPHKLKSCYFPCIELDIEQGRNLVERLPSLVDIPDFSSDVIVQHFLDWRKILGRQDAPESVAVWPFILERTNRKLYREHPHRCANMIYTLLQDFHGLQKNGQLLFPGDLRYKKLETVPVARTKNNSHKQKHHNNSSNNNNNGKSKKQKAPKVVEEVVEEKADFSIFDTFNSADGDY